LIWAQVWSSVAHDDAVGLGGDVDDAFGGRARAACVPTNADIVGTCRTAKRQGTDSGVVAACRTPKSAWLPTAVVVAACCYTAKSRETKAGIAATRLIQPQRTSPNSRIRSPRRRSTRSLIAYGYVVHVDIADRVLVAEGFVTDGYGLVAFYVGTESNEAYGDV
jgi:hypothetical protein